MGNPGSHINPRGQMYRHTVMNIPQSIGPTQTCRTAITSTPKNNLRVYYFSGTWWLGEGDFRTKIRQSFAAEMLLATIANRGCMQNVCWVGDG